MILKGEVSVEKFSKTNPVAKHSRNQTGAGAHKSEKDYDRKNKKLDIDEGIEESVASKIDRLILLEKMQEATNSGSLWFDYEEQIMKIKKDLSMDVI